MDCEKMMGKRARAFCAAVLFFAAMAIGFSACGNGEELEAPLCQRVLNRRKRNRR